MISSVCSHKNRFILLMNNLQENNIDHFPNINDHLKKHLHFNCNVKKYVEEIKHVIEDFDIRFNDFDKIEDVIQYLLNPFKNDLNNKHITLRISTIFDLEKNVIESELLILQTDLILKV